MSKTIVMIIASVGFQQIEYNVPKEIFTKAGYTVVTASNAPGTAVAKDNSKTTVDITLDAVNVAAYDAIVFIGGPGALEHLDNQTSYAIAQAALKQNKVLAAICISPRILAKAGVLNGKKATGWDSQNELEPIFKQYHATYIKKPVVTDGLIVTGNGPAAAQEFAQAVLDALKAH